MPDALMSAPNSFSEFLDIYPGVSSPASMSDQESRSFAYGPNAAGTNAAQATEVEVIDLCSDSEDDATMEMPPRKKAKLDTSSLTAIVDESDQLEIDKAIQDPEMEIEDLFSGEIWRPEILNEDGEEGVKEGSPRLQDGRAAAVEETLAGSTDSGTGEASTMMPIQIIAEVPENGIDAAVGLAESSQHTQEPPGHPRQEEQQSSAVDVLNGATEESSAKDDVLLIEVKNPEAFYHAHKSRADNTRPVVHTEIFQTQSGTQTRKMVGPFWIEDEDDRNSIDEAIGCSLEDRVADTIDSGKPSISTDQQRARSLTYFGYESERCSSRTLKMDSDKVKDAEIERGRRRREAEDKCMEMSRRMRKEALAKQKSLLQQAQHTGLSKGFLEDLSIPNIDPTPRTQNKRSISASSRSANARQPWRNGFDDDDNDLFSEKDLSAAAIEAQLDMAQAFANNHGDLPSPKELSRFRSPSTPASGLKTADNLAEADWQRRDSRDTQPRDFTRLPEKPLRSGGAGRIVTSGIERYDREQAEKLRRKKNEDNRKEHGESWDEEAPLPRDRKPIVPRRRESYAATQINGGAQGKDEARLLAAKEPQALPKQPLRAAPNVNGGLAKLVKSSRDQRRPNQIEEPSGPTYLPIETQSFTHQRSFTDGRSNQGPPLDKDVWTKHGTLRERKRDIQNLMNAFTETAKCWCVTHKSLNLRERNRFQLELEELQDSACWIVRGSAFKEKIAQQRLGKIKSNMVRRIGRHEKANGVSGSLSQHDISRQLVKLMGAEDFRLGQKTLADVLAEEKEHNAEQKKRKHRKRDRLTTAADAASLSKPRRLPHEHEERENSASELDGSTPRGMPNITYRDENARVQWIDQKLAFYDKTTNAGQEQKSATKVQLANEGLWDSGYDQTQSSGSESDEDKETARSSGRGHKNSDSIHLSVDQVGERLGPARSTIGGKGLLSKIRETESRTEGSNHVSSNAQFARKTLPSQSRKMQLESQSQSARAPLRTTLGGKLISSAGRGVQQSQLSSVETFDSEDGLLSDAEVDLEAESSFNDEDCAQDGLRERYGSQYDILADYENFDDQENSEAVLLGRHIDIQAANRQMRRVANDIIGSKLSKYSQMRIIWDIDDWRLAAQSIILPSGGDCQIRMKKSWAPVPDWPGKQGAVAGKSSCLYLVHETKRTSLRPPKSTADVADDEALFGPEDFVDPEAVVERERDMGYSDRECANQVAENRLVAYIKRHQRVGNAEGIADVTTLAEYMEQIEHDRTLFDQERRFWIETKEGRRGKEEIRIWVEKLTIDEPHA